MTPRLEPWVNLYPTTPDIRKAVAHLLQEWSGGHSEGIDRIQPACTCGFPQPYWQVTTRALRTHGPLPFTARGQAIHWHWWHLCTAGGRFDITETDLPENTRR